MSEALADTVTHTLFQRGEEVVIQAVEWLQLAVETMGALIIAIGVVVALFSFTRILLGRGKRDFFTVRLTLARYLALALEFQLGADILATAISPGWEQIGQLGAIAVIRTALNYFLMREMMMEQSHSQGAKDAA
jgi:uncharacterized membrane protein